MAAELLQLLKNIKTSSVKERRLIGEIKNKVKTFILEEKTNLWKQAIKDGLNSLQGETISPESLQSTWQTVFDAWHFLSRENGPTIKVPFINLPQKEIAEYCRTGHSFVYLPPELASANKVNLLLKGLFERPNLLFFERGSRFSDSFEDYTNPNPLSGWLMIESSPDTPRKGISKEEIKKIIEEKQTEPMTFNAYLLLGLLTAGGDKSEPIDLAQWGWSFLIRRCALPGTVNPDGDFLCSATNNAVDLSFSVCSYSQLEKDYDFRNLGIRLVKRFSSAHQPPLF